MTTTLELTAPQISDLRATLARAGFEFRDLQHAHFQARGPGVIVSAYRSGRVVVQGAAAAAFLQASGLDAPRLTGTVAGSDESGKGDYFGPLVVAAVVATPATEPDLVRAGVRDCKRLSDGVTLRAAKAIRDLCPHAVRSLSPAEYNARHEQEGNVAIFLSTMHAQAIASAVEEAGACDRVVIDKFTSSERLEAALRAEGVDLPVEIRPRAEDNPAVAAASVLARAEFLIGLERLGSEHGLELPKGANPDVERVARQIFRAGGYAELAALVKTHFKTTKRVTGDLF